MARELQDPSGATVRPLDVDPRWEAGDKDHLAWLCNETVQEGNSVLIFCGSKVSWCRCCATSAQGNIMYPGPHRLCPVTMLLTQEGGSIPVPPMTGTSPLSRTDGARVLAKDQTYMRRPRNPFVLA